MADIKAQVAAPLGQEFPNPEIPTIFADGIMNLANSYHVVKFYLFRFDPGIINVNTARVDAAHTALENRKVSLD
jgi:hypothetical protein